MGDRFPNNGPTTTTSTEERLDERADSPKRVAVIGSTGSIGRATLEVIAGLPGRFEVVGLAAGSNAARLCEQAVAVRPRWIALADAQAAEQHDWASLPADVELRTGSETISQMAAQPEVDIVVSAIVGRAGLEGTLAAVEAGKRVALANKESLVVAGSLVVAAAGRHSAELLPVDSEHSAVFQALQAGGVAEVQRVVLTASGGPFRTFSTDQLAEVTIEQALTHPTWAMGRKITIDSATLMNKALELIEARWLFDLSAEQLDVVIHPQSIVHSLVEFVDGSVVAQLGPPDMRLPIQYALTWPERCRGVATRLDFSDRMNLQFEPPDEERFPAIRLGREVARVGGTAGAVFSGANEAAVDSFLGGGLRFDRIVPAVEAALHHHTHDSNPTLERLLELDRWARQEVSRWILLD